MTSLRNHAMSFVPSLAGALLGVAVLLNATAALAQAAARVTFAAGNVSIVAANGTTRQALRNAEVNPGETVTTAVDSWAQLRFSDGAMTSLQPETGFKIDEYQFKGSADGNERGYFSLLKGALRTITGAIGHGTRRDNYRVTTATATIGIRGTEYLARLDNGLTVSVGDGRVALINDAGEFVLGPGQTGFVADSRTLPRLVIQKPVVSTPEPLREEPRFVAAEQRRADGKSTAVTSDEHSSSSSSSSGSEQFAIGIVATTGAAQMSQAANYAGATTSDFELVTSGTTLQKFRYSSMVGDIGTATALETGTIGSLTYGRWTTPGATATGWGAGTPWGVGSVTDPQVVYLFGNAATLPTTGTLSLSPAGGTSPVNSAGTTGTFNSGSMSVDFGAGTYSFSINFSVAGATYGMTSAGSQNLGSAGRIENTNTAGTCTGGGCGGSSGLPSAWSGLIRPTQAGLVYGIQDSAGANKTVTGVQVFQ